MLTKADRERLKDLTPEMVERWLTANGWQVWNRNPTCIKFESQRGSHPIWIASEFWQYLAGDHRQIAELIETLNVAAAALDRYPHEILAEMLQPGCKVETVVWFRFGDRQPEEGQRIVLQENVTADFVNGVWCQAFCTCKTNPDDLWRPLGSP